MNSLTKRKITAIAVSVMLVVAIVTTGILCAPRFNTPNNEGGVGLSSTDVSYTQYVDKLTRLYNRDEASIIHITDQDNSEYGVDIIYPKDIYVDKSENLSDMGYYFYFFMTGRSSGQDKVINAGKPLRYQHYAMNLLGYFNNTSGQGKAYDNADDAGRKLMDTFNGYELSYNINNKNTFGSLQSVYVTDDGKIPVSGHEYRDGSANKHYGMLFNANKGTAPFDATITMFMRGNTPNSEGDFDYITTTFNQKDPANAKLMLMTTEESGGSGWSSKFATDFSSTGNESRTFTGAWINHLDANGNATSTAGDVTYDYTKDTKSYSDGSTAPMMNIKIHVYDKNALATAINNLQKSVNELSGLAVATGGEGVNSIAAANKLIEQGNAILNVRKVSAEQVRTLTDAMNNFAFDVERPNPMYPAWTFGEKNNGGITYLNELWSKYNGDYAKYFNVNINCKVYGEFDNDKTGAYEDINMPLVYSEDTYKAYAYVQDAGDYVIKFTPRDPKAYNSEIKHAVRWSTAGEAYSQMTLTIDRANMDVEPQNVTAQQYTGEAQRYSMATGGTIVSLKGGMKADNAGLVVKLLKSHPGAYNDPRWDSAPDNQIEFTEIGVHKVYYRIQAKNHIAYVEKYEVEIIPADVTITFGARSINKNTSGGVLTYGDSVLSSEDMISQGVVDVKMNGAVSSVVNKDTLKDILTVGLYVNGAFVADNLTNAGDHRVKVKEDGYKPVTQSAVEKAENPKITSWSQRINVTLKDESACYTIAKKEINIVWGEISEQIYDGKTNHRPTATVKAGDEVAGGEEFDARQTYILKGEEVGLSGDNAGRITVGGVEYPVPLSGVNAIWAGTYKVGVVCPDDSNYTISESTRTTDFEIKQRKLSVNVLDRESDYARAINEFERANAASVRDIYQNVMFNNNQGVNKVYEFVDNTSLAETDTADIVFEVDIVDVPTTNSDHSSLDSFYCAGVYQNALVARMRTAGEFDTKGNPVDMNRIRSYAFDYEAGAFTVYAADIESSRLYMRKTFDGTEQAFALIPDRIGLTGYEELHKNDAGVVKFTYSTSINGPFSENLITIRDYNGNGQIIYYQVEAENHNKTAVKSFIAYIDRLSLDITIGQQTTTFYYGDEIPDSNGIISALNITYVPRKSDKDEDQTPSDFVIDGKLQFCITNESQKVTDRKIGAGFYTVTLEPVSELNSLNNYNINYTGRNGSGNDNENAFEISQRPLIVDWRQSGENWLEDGDGMHFVYNATTPTIQPTVKAYRNADLSIYNENSTGANTSDNETDGMVENYVDGDEIKLRDQRLGGSTYNVDGYPTNKTELRDTNNIKNYVLVNPTSRYYINQRTVKINVFDQSATYGNAKSVAMGGLISASEVGANWKYNADNKYEFIRDHYMNWQLTSEAIAGSATDYHDADTYPIVLSEKVGNDGTVAGNYIIIVYTQHKDGTVESQPSDHSNAATFTIEKATLNLARREFNFDASPKDPESGNNDPKERCYLNVGEIRNIVRVVGATTQNQVSITMSEAIQYDESGQVTGKAEDYQLTTDREIEITTRGKYYVWIKMINSNYKVFTGTVDVNYLTNWISILLDGQITANYGDTVMQSNELFENLKVKEITGVMDDSGVKELKKEEAWKAIQDRGYFTLFVGKGNKTPLDTNERVQEYSVYMDINKDNVGSGENELHFRFIGAEIGKGTTSNVNAYKVIERPVYLVWDPNVNETYGDHSDTSLSHTGYTVMNVLKDDNVKVEIEYKADLTSNTPGEKKGNHVHYVGDYIATLVGVSMNANYRVAVVGDRIQQEGGSYTTVNIDHLVKKFSINRREITVTIEDQQLVYGSLDARENAVGSSSNNIYNFVNASSAYTVSGDGLFAEDVASDIFELNVIYDLEEGCNYLAADRIYRIRGSKKNTKIADQYEVKFLRKDGGASEHDAQLEITRADFTIDSMTFHTIYFDGGWHSPLGTDDNIAALSYTFAGDTEYAYANRRVYFNADVNAPVDASTWELVKDKDHFYEEALRFRNAGVNRFAVKVETLNHNPRVRNDITFEILSVNVNIDMTKAAEKTYGEVIEYNGERGTEKAISDYIKANTGLTYEVTTGRDPWSVINLDDSFIFYVVAGGENGVDSGEGIEAGNFANSVGYYRVYHKFADGEEGNYNVTYTQKDSVGCNAKAFKINPKEVNVTWHLEKADGTFIDAPTSFTYTGKSPIEMGLRAKFVAVRYNETTKELEEYDEILYIDGAQSADASKTPYTVSANFGMMKTVAMNYTLKPSTTSFQYVINPREIVVILKDQSKTVYGSAITFDDGTDAWVVDDEEWDDIPYMVLNLNLPTLGAGKKFVPSGDYEIQATCGSTNFDVTFKAEDGTDGWGKFTIRDAEITNVPDHMDDLKYNGADQNVDIYKHISEHLDTALSIKGDMTWEQAKVTYKNANGQYVSEMPKVKNAGETVVEFKITLDNHEDFEGKMSVNVSKASIVFNADVVEVQYGEKTLESAELFKNMKIRINNSESDPIAVNLDELVSFHISENAKDVKEYYLQIDILGDAGDNFDISLSKSAGQTQTPYHIVPRVITVDWGNTTRIYKGEDWYFTANGFGNLVGDETISNPTYSLVDDKGNEYTAKASQFGKYQVKIFVNGSNSNYVVDEDCRYQTFTILPKEVEVEWNVQNFTYDGAGHMLEARIVGGVLSEDSCNITTYSPKVVSAGTHTASIVKLDNDNYTVPANATAEFTIEQKEVHIVWVVENFVYDGTTQCIKAYVNTSDLIGDDTCEVIVSGGGVDAGTHRAIVSELKNPNYKLPEGGAGQEFSIAPRVIKSIVWTNTSLTYNEINGVPQSQVPTASVGDGMVSGDVVEFEISIAQGVAINAGSYRATVVGVNNKNYILDSVVSNDSTNFEIKKAENSLGNDIKLPVKDGGLPALADFESVLVKYGSPVVKYYTNAELTDEYTGNLNDAPKGKYYVVVMVEGTENYDTVSRTFEVDVDGKSNKAGLIAGIVVPIVVLAVAGAVVAIILVKKKKGNKAEQA